jgi:hypothetical protein
MVLCNLRDACAQQAAYSTVSKAFVTSRAGGFKIYTTWSHTFAFYWRIDQWLHIVNIQLTRLEKVVKISFKNVFIRKCAIAFL